MPKQVIHVSSAPTVGATPGQAGSPVAQAIRFGNMLFVSGQGAVDPATGAVVAGDIATQTRLDRKSTRLNSSHIPLSRMPSSA